MNKFISMIICGLSIVLYNISCAADNIRIGTPGAIITVNPAAVQHYITVNGDQRKRIKFGYVGDK